MFEFFKFVICFFNGWRRRLGLVSLIMALLFMAYWVRSFVVEAPHPFVVDLIDFSEYFDFPVEDHAIAGFGTYNHSLVLMAYQSVDVKSSPTTNGSFIFSVNGSQPQGKLKAYLEDPLSEDGTQIMVENTNGTTKMMVPMSIFAIPYWSLTVPLTLLSLWLLLSRPRKSIQTKLNVPSANERA